MTWMIAEAETPAGTTEQTVVTMEPTTPAGETTTSTQQNGAPAAGDETQKPAPGNPMMQFVLMGLIVVVMYFMLFRAPKKRQQEHKKMVETLKKNDRVRTIGGILGVVLDVRDDEIVLKIDEANNTKIRVIPSAIATVIGEDKKSQ
jgi:preprotein translocase subunit YajC